MRFHFYKCLWGFEEFEEEKTLYTDPFWADMGHRVKLYLSNLRVVKTQWKGPPIMQSREIGQFQ